MVPSSIQWTMTPPAHILVYPISRYVISPVIKSPETIVNRRVQRQTATTSRTSKTVRRCSKSRFRHRFPYNCDNHQYKRSRQNRHLQTYPSKRSPYCSKRSPYALKHAPYRWRNDCSRSRCDKSYGSRDTCSSGVRSAIQRRSKHAPHDRKQEQDEDMNLDVVMESEEDDEDEEDEEEYEDLEAELEDCDYECDNDNIYNDDDHYDDDDDDKINKDENDGDEHEEQLVLQWPGTWEDEHRRSDYVDDVTITCGWEPRPPVDELNNPVMRCSANVVLLAHGNRSLYVLTIQRNQVTSVVSTSSVCYKNRRSSSNTVISYKLPGGQFILSDDEQHNYHIDGRNTCTCPDDQKWYSAAIYHFMTQLTARGPTTLVTTSSMMTTTTGQAIDDQPQFIPLGNWYRTQQDDDYKAILAAGGANYDHRHRSNSNYYPYKPAHVSRKLAGHKRVYAVPDACHLFPGAEHTFQLQTPYPKTKTTTTRTKIASTKTKKTTVTITTTYKCKFVPLARLHENSRLYGPVLSSLPVVLSSTNLVFSP